MLKDLPTGDTLHSHDCSEEEEHSFKSNINTGKISKVRALLELVQKQKQRAADSSVYSRLLRRAKSQKVSLLNTEELSLLRLMDDESPTQSPVPPTPLDFDSFPTQTYSNIQYETKKENSTINAATIGSIAERKQEENFSFEEAFGKCNHRVLTDDGEESSNFDLEIASIKFKDSSDQYSLGDHNESENDNDFSLIDDEEKLELFPESPFSLEPSQEESDQLFPENPFPDNMLSSNKTKKEKSTMKAETDDFLPDQPFPKEAFPDDTWTEQQPKDLMNKKEILQASQASATNPTNQRNSAKKQTTKKSQNKTLPVKTDDNRKFPSVDKPRLVADLDWEDGKGQYTGVSVMTNEGVLVAHGRGTLIFADGSVYMGPFRYGCMHGSGATYQSADGGEYFGGYKQNRKHGFGEEKFSNGSRYVGQYRNDIPNGFGIQYSGKEDDDAVYCGDWKDGQPAGMQKKKLSGKVVASDDFLGPAIRFVSHPSSDEALPKFKSKLQKECQSISRNNSNDDTVQDTSIQSDETKIHVNTAISPSVDSADSHNSSPSTSTNSVESSSLSDYEISRYDPAHEELMMMEETKRSESRSPTSFRAMESLLSED